VADHIFTTGAPSILTTVVLAEVTWTDHIQRKHGDVPLQAIMETIKDPCFVYESRTVPNDFLFINTFAVSRTTGHPLRVPVINHGDGTGTVKTAYFASTAGQGKLLWTRGDD
jgi:hypothetical protein